MGRSQEVDRICEKQFTFAKVARYVHALDADDYYFGVGKPCGLGVLRLLSDMEIAGEPTVLDIGAGRGTFLKEVIGRRDGDVRAIGFTAVDQGQAVEDGIQWVFGDFQRQRTWSSASVFEPNSVDLAVSSLTFQHFVHPIAGLQAAFRALRVGGQLLIDDLQIPIDPETPEVADSIVDELEHNLGSLGGYITRARGKIDARFMHFEKNTTELPFQSVRAMAATDGSDKIVYRAA